MVGDFGGVGGVSAGVLQDRPGRPRAHRALLQLCKFWMTTPSRLSMAIPVPDTKHPMIQAGGTVIWSLSATIWQSCLQIPDSRHSWKRRRRCWAPPPPSQVQGLGRSTLRHRRRSPRRKPSGEINASPRIRPGADGHADSSSKLPPSTPLSPPSGHLHLKQPDNPEMVPNAVQQTLPIAVVSMIHAISTGRVAPRGCRSAALHSSRALF